MSEGKELEEDGGEAPEAALRTGLANQKLLAAPQSCCRLVGYPCQELHPSFRQGLGSWATVLNLFLSMGVTGHDKGYELPHEATGIFRC